MPWLNVWPPVPNANTIGEVCPKNAALLQLIGRMWTYIVHMRYMDAYTLRPYAWTLMGGCQWLPPILYSLLCISCYQIIEEANEKVPVASRQMYPAFPKAESMPHAANLSGVASGYGVSKEPVSATLATTMPPAAPGHVPQKRLRGSRRAALVASSPGGQCCQAWRRVSPAWTRMTPTMTLAMRRMLLPTILSTAHKLSSTSKRCGQCFHRPCCIGHKTWYSMAKGLLFRCLPCL